MKPLITANFEYIEDVQFIVALLYGEDGLLLDVIARQCETPADGIKAIQYLADFYLISTVELWTSNNALYLESLKTAGVPGIIKHPSDTIQTRRVIEQDRDLFIDLYAILPRLEKPKLPRWRNVLAGAVRKLLKTIEGNGKFEI